MNAKETAAYLRDFAKGLAGDRRVDRLLAIAYAIEAGDGLAEKVLGVMDLSDVSSACREECRTILESSLTLAQPARAMTPVEFAKTMPVGTNVILKSEEHEMESPFCLTIIKPSRYRTSVYLSDLALPDAQAAQPTTESLVNCTTKKCILAADHTGFHMSFEGHTWPQRLKCDAQPTQPDSCTCKSLGESGGFWDRQCPEHGANEAPPTWETVRAAWEDGIHKIGLSKLNWDQAFEDFCSLHRKYQHFKSFNQSKPSGIPNSIHDYGPAKSGGMDGAPDGSMGKPTLAAGEEMAKTLDEIAKLNAAPTRELIRAAWEDGMEQFVPDFVEHTQGGLPAWKDRMFHQFIAACRKARALTYMTHHS